MRTLSFYFDFVSPYAYLSFRRVVLAVEHYDLALEAWPVDLAELKRLAGNTGPSTREIPIKLKHLRVDMQRWAKKAGLPLTPPRGYGSARLNQGAFFAQDRKALLPYVETAWTRVWGEGAAMDADETLASVAQDMGWDVASFMNYVSSEAAQRRLAESTWRAHEHEVFGVPTLLLDGQMWWGNDRLAFFEEYLGQQANVERGVE